MLETVPAFLAASFEVTTARRLAALQRELQALPTAPPPATIAWLSPSNLRLVLRYLGPIDPALAPGFLDPMREIAATASPVRIQLGPLQAFPSMDAARLLIAQLSDPTGLLAELMARIEQVVASLGIAPPRHPFESHVTLARFEQPASVQTWLSSAEPLTLDSRLTELAAFVHIQKRPGSEHLAIDRFPLSPPTRPSQRPSKAPKQASQRPSRRPKADPAAPRVEAIPGPPRVPGIALPGPLQSADARLADPSPSAPTAPKTGESAAEPAPAANAAQPGLPPDDEWG